MYRKILTFSLLSMVMAAASAFGQASFGELKGFVYDQQGAVVPGAQVTVTSPAMMGDRATETNEKGFYRVISLPPGEYTVRVSKANYKQFEQKGVTISVDKTVGLNVTLEVGVFEEVVTVIGEAPLIDVESPHQKINITGELQRALPTTVRNNFSEVMRIVPGAALNDPNRPQYSYYSVKGASSYYENNWTIDGARLNQWEYSYMSARINLDAVDDVAIGIAGASALNPVGQGGTIHLTTKSGGNEFHGSATLRYQPSKWNDNNIEGGVPADNDFFEPGYSIGGYVLKDKLWFFSAGRYTKINEGLSRTPSVIAKARAAYSGFSPDRIDKTMKDLFIKFTYMHSDKHMFSFGYQNDWGYETFAPANYAPEAYIDEGTVGPVYNATWNWFVSDNLNLFSQVSFMDKNRDRFGRARDQVSKRVYEDTYLSGGLITGWSDIVIFGNYSTEFQVDEAMLNISSTATYYIDDFYGTHDVKFGFYGAPRNYNQFKYFYPTKPFREYYVLSDPSNPASSQILFFRQTYDREVAEYPAAIGRNYAGFVNNTWRPNPRLTIEAGLRFDHIGHSEELFGNRFDYISINDFSPNVGVNYALTSDRKNILRAGYSLRRQNYTAYTLPESGMGIQHAYTNEYDNNLDGVMDFVYRVEELVRDAEDRPSFDDLNLGYSHDIIVGYTRELPWNATISVDYTYRQFKNMLTWYNTNPIIQNGVFVGVKDPTYPWGEYWEVLNNTWNWKEYQSFDVTFNRSARGLTVLASMMYEIGTLKGDWGPYDWSGFLQPGHFASYSDDGGKWGGGDRGFTYRLNATYLAPYGINVATSIVGQSGPRSGYVYYYLDANDPEIEAHGPSWLLQDGYWVFNPLYTDERIWGSDRKNGQWRSPMFHIVSVRVGKEFNLKQHKFGLYLDIFNLMNSATSLDPDSRGRDYNSQYFGKDSPYDLLGARSAQLMIRYSF
jgi:hypothetical protein